MINGLSPFRRMRESVKCWFTLTPAETASLLLVLGIALLGVAAKLFWFWRGE